MHILYLARMLSAQPHTRSLLVLSIQDVHKRKQYYMLKPIEILKNIKSTPD